MKNTTIAKKSVNKARKIAGLPKLDPLAVAIIEGTSPAIVMGEAEAITETICADTARAEGTSDKPAFVDIDNSGGAIPDELTTATQTWNSKEIAPITLRDPARSVLARFEYVPQAGEGAFTGYSRLVCSDNGKPVGKPFAGSYGLLNNDGFMGVIETICAVLDKLGLKWSIATTGSLMERERTFCAIQLAEGGEVVIGGRVFKAFLNCLNSIPSNSGCTVTFANNTFCVCCRNTFAHVLQNKNGEKFHAAIKHTKGMKAALADIPVLVEAYFANNNALFANLKAFSVFPVGLVDAENYFTAFIGRTLKGELTDKTELKTRSANIVETLQGLFVKGKGNNGETALDLFSAVTEFYTHFSAGESEDRLKQYTSSEVGDGYVNKGEFYQWLVKHAQSKASFQAVARVGETLLINYRKGGK